MDAEKVAFLFDDPPSWADPDDPLTAAGGDRRLAGRLHLGPRRCCRPYAGHVLSELEKALEVLGVDDPTRRPRRAK